jgi:sporulation protein YhbH
VALNIAQDHARFRDIVRGRVRENLRRYISNGELIARQGRDKVSIPVPQIDIPRFRFGDKSAGGVGQGKGSPGDPVGQGEGEGDEAGQGRKAGQGEGDHALEVDLSLDELAQILGEELALPRIENRGRREIQASREKYTGIRRTGPESLKHFKRTFREALKRQIASGLYRPERPVIIPTREDKRFKSWQVAKKPVANAAIIYMMDVSGSMGDEQKEVVRIESFWIDTWLRSQYKGLESVYITHDAAAREVDRDTFFRTRESGGTMISSAYKLCAEIMQARFPADEWNVYPFHFSDGDNWSADDTTLCVRLLQDRVLPAANLFCYGQVESPYGSGQFIKDLRERLGEDERVATSEIRDKDAIVDSIKAFLGKGR